jgi:hypothetical protein
MKVTRYEAQRIILLHNKKKDEWFMLDLSLENEISLTKESFTNNSPGVYTKWIT